MTEKSYAPSSKENKIMKAQAPVKQDANLSKAPKKEAKEEKTEKPKESKKQKEIPKKNFAVVNAFNAPVSSKVSMDLCRFLRYKTIIQAMKELNEITQYKRALPMKGEYPHRKGRMMSGRYPQNATAYFIKLLKTLDGNSAVNRIEEPVISEAYANFAGKQRARFGRWERKRTNITLKSMDKKKFMEMREKKMKNKNGGKRN